MDPILVDKTVFLYLSEVHTLTRCVTERRFQQKILRIPLQDLSPSSPVNKNPPRGRIIVHNAFYNLSWLGWGRGGSTLAILRLTALYNFEPEEEYSKEPKERERWHQKIPPHHPDRISRLKSWEALAGGASPLLLHGPLCAGKSENFFS